MTSTDTHPDARTDAGARQFGAGTVYTLLAALGFGAVSTLTSIALAERVGLWNVLTWRYVLGAVVMVAFVGTQRYPRMPWREAVRFIVVGGGGQALLVGLALSSVRYITVATLAFLFYTYPAWVTLVQTVRGAERLTARRILALALSFGGIAVIASQTAAASAAGGATLLVPGLEWKGVALALGAAAVYGIYIPTMQHLQKNHPIPATSAYAKIGSAICFLLVASGTGSLTYTMSATAWEAIVALTLFSTVMPSVFFLMGLMRLGPVRTAIVSTIEPFFTAVLGALVLRQPITPSIVLGGAMIASAMVVLQYRRERVA
jgi:drug/metabolite transporter (DMT)-like permease